MTQHITLTATEAQTLNTTGYLEGFKELCDVCNKPLTPTRAVGQVYACKEPCMSDFGRGNERRVWFESESGEFDLTAEEMPDWAVRLHAKIATEPTLSIHEGKLVWTYDLVKE